MTTTEIYTILKSWINTVLNTELNKDLTIIRGEQNAPQPNDHFLVIHQPMAIRQVGKDMDQKTDSGGNINYVNRYEATISLEEVGGADNGDNLRILLNSLIKQTIKDYFMQSKISILRTGDVTPIPQMLENQWKLRSTIDLFVLFPDEGTYEAGYIETVEWTGTYSGTVN